MASSASTKAQSASSPVISTRRKTEVLGLVLMVLALLLSLAFVTYHPADDAVAQAAPLVDALLNPSEYPPVDNALGLLGAELAQTLVPGFLGYSILFFSVSLMVWGYAVFRHWTLGPLVYPTGLALLSAFIVACLIGWFAHTLQTPLVRWAGAVGMGMAGWMQGVFGQPGSFILLLLIVSVMLLLVVDHDIQRSVDRFVELVRRVEEKVQSAWTAWTTTIAETDPAQGQSSDNQAEPSVADAEKDAHAKSTDSESETSESTETNTRTHTRPDEPSDSEPKPSTEPGDTRQGASTSDSGDESSSEPPPVTVRVPDSVGDGRPLRRNDLFRDRIRDASDADADAAESSSGDDFDLEELEDEFGKALEDPTAAPPTDTGDDSEATTSQHAASASPSEQEDDASSAPLPHHEPSADETGDAPVRQEDDTDVDEDASDAPPPRQDDVELTVKERIEEEKADEIERPADTPEKIEYESPPLDLLEEPTNEDPSVNRDELEKNKRLLLDKLDTYNIEIQNISAVVGPTVTRYELTPAPGVKVSRIKSLEDDLAMALAAPGVRMIAPIPGKSAVGVEIPNRDRELVRLREVLGTAKFRDTDMILPIPMGKTIEGEVFLADLTKMPHLLIAGATGSGKSVGLNSLLTGLIYACHPANLRFVIIDPKKIELQQYTALKTQFVAQPEDIDQTVITDIEEASGVLKSVEKEMEERYDLLSGANVRGIEGYNEKFKAGELSPEDGHRHMPYIVVVVDELADLMMSVGDDIEGPISRLAQMARAVGIHLVLATQRPSVDVITGVIKANFPSRIAYEVASMADSRTILDQGGAEGLVGNGDMLFLSGSDLRRLQGPFVRVEEVESVVNFVSDQPGVTPYTLPSLMDAGHGPTETLGVEDTDENFEEAARIIVRRQQGSVSLLQRKLAVGYTRAARIVDQLEEAGIVGPFNGTKARDVLVDTEDELDRLLRGEDDTDEES